MTQWYEGPLAALALRARRPGTAPEPDTTADADPELDRLCAAAVAVQQAPQAPAELHLPPGTPALAAGPAADCVARFLATHATGRPLVVLNAPYDLTLLDRELRRHTNVPLANRLGGRGMCVLDPVLLDRRLNRTPGATSPHRGLDRLCDNYGVAVPAETVQDEAVAALALARALGRRFASQLAGLTPATLHTLQAVWFAAEASGTAAWFTSGTRRAADHIWPLRPMTTARFRSPAANAREEAGPSG
ncbi:hypothetical protein [Streptomyces sp. WMMB 322]|uniref:hypothetical protein n=1 Tax=Streptomyces sp. WMMB 322 TaxID=1286821 RepID=UPI0006E354AF|nr:hypothetical protein [Streptomyces sp. WMMB 322]SCK43646.1 DNA polymerase-3 subunit epsilon [Streptomyces sp. WMMB 322]